jgi:hypothetical protein
MIRLAHGRNDTGHTMMQAIEIPTDRAPVADYMAKAWAEAAGWTEIVIRTPKEGHRVVGPIRSIPGPKWLDDMAAAWKRAKRR